MSSRAVALAVACLAPLAVAQTTAIAPPLQIRAAADPNNDTYTFGASECAATLTVNWKVNYNTGAYCGPLKLWATRGECGDAPVSGDVSYDDVSQFLLPTLQTGTIDVVVATLPGFQAAADGGVGVCGEPGLQITHRVCGSVSSAYTCGTVAASVTRASQLNLIFDTKPPAAPRVGDVTALDRSIRVGFTVDADTSTVKLLAKAVTEADFLERGSVAASASSVLAKNLQNNVEYQLVLVAYDSAGNESERSEVKTGIPIKTTGFWGAYKDAGGTDPAGCAVAPTFFWPLALVALGRLALRRRAR